MVVVTYSLVVPGPLVAERTLCEGLPTLLTGRAHAQSLRCLGEMVCVCGGPEGRRGVVKNRALLKRCGGAAVRSRQTGRRKTVLE